MIYAAALTFGPVVGSISGGLGSMLADLVVAPVYAPGTLVIKSLEGFVVGLLGEKLRKLARSIWRIYMASGGVVGGSLIAIIGLNFYSGEMVVGLERVTPTFKLWVPEYSWILVGLAFFTTTLYLGFRGGPETFGELVAAVSGGSLMILGYYMYEVLLLSLGIIPLEVGEAAYIVALVEVPFNIMQLLVGVLVGIPVARRLRSIIRK